MADALYAPKAEAELVGACLLSSLARDVLCRDLTPGDLYQPEYRRWAEAICDLHHGGGAVDPATVLAWVTDRYDAIDTKREFQTLTTLMAECGSTGSAVAHAARIRDRAARRALVTVLDETRQRVVKDLAIPVEDHVDFARAQMLDVDLPIVGQSAPPSTFSEFMAQTEEVRWAVPRTLERGDRLIITSDEGLGKSTLLRQWAIQFAAGIHPWANGRFTPIRTLLIDVENSPAQVRREMQPLRARVAALGQGKLGHIDSGFDPDRVHIACRSKGIDLLSRADRRWFTDQVAHAQPDVILTGPLYKLHQGNPLDEEPAKQLSDYLDEIRTRFDCCLIIEAHSPYGSDGRGQRTIRPYGASLWSRWPEFGFALKLAKEGTHWEWKHWRGARDRHRWWPNSGLRHGAAWPWEPVTYHDDDEPF